jgi:hypothetical protein
VSSIVSGIIVAVLALATIFGVVKSASDNSHHSSQTPVNATPLYGAR